MRQWHLGCRASCMQHLGCRRGHLVRSPMQDNSSLCIKGHTIYGLRAVANAAQHHVCLRARDLIPQMPVHDQLRHKASQAAVAPTPEVSGLTGSVSYWPRPTAARELSSRARSSFASSFTPPTLWHPAVLGSSSRGVRRKCICSSRDASLQTLKSVGLAFPRQAHAVGVLHCAPSSDMPHFRCPCSSHPFW